MSAKTIERRRQLSEYKDLFQALFKIKDDEVQKRVMRAINGILNDKCDCKCCQKSCQDASTQTESHQQQQNITELVKKEELPENGSPTNERKLEVNGEREAFKVGEKFVVHANVFQDREVKHRRKRTLKIPRVEKVSTSGEPQRNLRTSHEYNNKRVRFNNNMSVKEYRASSPTISEMSTGCDVATMVSYCQSEFTEARDVVTQFKKEYESCAVFDPDGLLPIHQAIIGNDVKKLQRQIYVFKFLKMNINIPTKCGQSPLQLALKTESIMKIIEVLLENNVDLDEIDQNGNTVIHLSVMYSTKSQILKYLLEKVDIDILCEVNDNGFSPLHLAVRENKFYVCKQLIEHINRYYKIENIAEGIQNKTRLVDIYETIIKNLPDMKPVAMNDEKMKILNQVDMKCGRTALYFAVEQKSTLLVYLLLTELADPRIYDYSDTNSHEFALDHFRESRILTALLHTMDYIKKCSTIFVVNGETISI